jgi:hypothetical protein
MGRVLKQAPEQHEPHPAQGQKTQQKSVGAKNHCGGPVLDIQFAPLIIRGGVSLYRQSNSVAFRATRRVTTRLEHATPRASEESRRLTPHVKPERDIARRPQPDST